jgi:hypothetical protein
MKISNVCFVKRQKNYSIYFGIIAVLGFEFRASGALQLEPCLQPLFS